MSVHDLHPDQEPKRLYREACFSAETRVQLDLAVELLEQVQGRRLEARRALAGVREVCEQWDANVGTEVEF